MSEENTPVPVEPERSKSWPERELDHIRGQLREGSRTMGELRTGLERARDELGQVRREIEVRLAAMALAEKDANEEIRRFDARGRAEIETRIDKLEDALSPRATAPRILAWIAAVVLAVGPIVSWAWVRFEQLDTRQRATEIEVRTSKERP